VAEAAALAIERRRRGEEEEEGEGRRRARQAREEAERDIILLLEGSMADMLCYGRTKTPSSASWAKEEGKLDGSRRGLELPSFRSPRTDLNISLPFLSPLSFENDCNSDTRHEAGTSKRRLPLLPSLRSTSLQLPSRHPSAVSIRAIASSRHLQQDQHQEEPRKHKEKMKLIKPSWVIHEGIALSAPLCHSIV
jgi:hypothetical protein